MGPRRAARRPRAGARRPAGAHGRPTVVPPFALVRGGSGSCWSPSRDAVPARTARLSGVALTRRRARPGPHGAHEDREHEDQEHQAGPPPPAQAVDAPPDRRRPPRPAARPFPGGASQPTCMADEILTAKDKSTAPGEIFKKERDSRCERKKGLVGVSSGRAFCFVPTPRCRAAAQPDQFTSWLRPGSPHYTVPICPVCVCVCVAWVTTVVSGTH